MKKVCCLFVFCALFYFSNHSQGVESVSKDSSLLKSEVKNKIVLPSLEDKKRTEDIKKACSTFYKANIRTKDSSEGKILSLIIPVAAAILGAALTFFASQYTNRVNWLRAQRDALRDKKLNAISEAAKVIGESLPAILTIQSELNEIVNYSGESNVEKEGMLLKLKTIKSKWINAIKSASSIYSLSHVELKLVGVPDDISNVFVDIQTYSSDLINNIETLGINENDIIERKVVDLIDAISAESEKFVTKAQDFHRGAYE